MSLSGQYLLCLFCFFGRKGGYGGWGQDKENQENFKEADRNADPADDDRPGDNGHAASELAGNRLVNLPSVTHLHGLSQILDVKIDEILAVEEEEDDE